MIRRGLSAAFVVVVMVTALAGAAAAHVVVQPAGAPAGAPGAFAFRVPNEEETAATVLLAVQFPRDHPIATVSAMAPVGWTAKVTMRTAADGTAVVDSVTWTGGRIEPGAAQYFDVTTSPLPTGVDQLVFAATQTYSNGDVIRWDEPEVPGGAEPAHPAPVLHLTGAGAGASSVPPAPTTGASTPPTTAAPATAAPDPSSSSAGRIVVLVVVVAVVATAALVARQRRRAHR